jgi:hypothetical protein
LKEHPNSKNIEFVDKKKNKTRRGNQVRPNNSHILKGSIQTKPVNSNQIKRKPKTKKDMEYWKMMKLAIQIQKKEKRKKNFDLIKKEQILNELREKRKMNNEKKQSNQPISMMKSNILKNSKERSLKSGRTESIQGRYLEKNKLKFYIRKGNNQQLLLELMKKRGWWGEISTKKSEGKTQ